MGNSIISGGNVQLSNITGTAGTINLPDVSVTGSTGASSMATGQDWIDVSGLTNAVHNITITFTNLSSPTLAIYRNKA